MSNDDEQLEVLKSKKLLTNHKGKFVFKPGGLVKKTISIRIGDHPHHLVCYYNKKDFCQGHLGHSSFNADLMTELRKVRIPAELMAQQSFRKPSGIVVDAVPPQQQSQTRDVKRKGAVSKRRSSFPGAMANRSRKDSLTEFVPIAPADPLIEINDIFPMSPALQEQSIGNLEMIANLYNPMSLQQSQNGSRDDIFLSSLPYSNDLPSEESSNCQAEPNYDPQNAMKWSSIFTSPEMANLKNELNIGSPIMYQNSDPVMPCVRPPSSFLDMP